MIQLQKVLSVKAKDCLRKQIDSTYCTYYEKVIIC